MLKKVLCVLAFIVSPIFACDIDIKSLKQSDVKSAHVQLTLDQRSILSGWILLHLNKTITFDNNEDGTYRGKVIDHNEICLYRYGRWEFFGETIYTPYPTNEKHISVNRLAFDRLALLAITQGGMKKL